MERAEIEKLVQSQKRFFTTGITKRTEFRKQALQRLRRAILEYQQEIQDALKADLKKSSFESYMCEIGMTLSELSYIQKHVDRWSRARRVPTPLAQFPADSLVIPEPYGCVLVMAPWNYPFLLSMDPLIGAIAAGNCCILKPSAYAPHVSAVIKKLIESIFPPQFAAVAEGGREENAILLEQRFDYIFFTGSVSVGKLVMEKAAKYLTPVTLELGGKSPCIVDETADLSLAAKRIVFGKFLNSGQTCVAPDYVLVHKKVRKELIRKLQFWTEKFWGKEPLAHPDYPRMINEKHYRRVLGLIQGEHAVLGGYGCADSLQIAPTILTEVTEDSPMMQEEIFGPVLPVLEFTSIQEAEAFVREREKPLALYLFTRDARTEKQILRNLSFGGGCVNDTIIHLATSHMGFGGVGHSGMGSYHGRKSFETFSHEKGIMKRYSHPDLPIRYLPYSRTKEWLLRRFLH